MTRASPVGQDRAGQQVRAALRAVVDPALGRTITSLGLVKHVAIDRGRVHVRLRAPSYFEVHHHGWMVLADVRAALGVLPWVDDVSVCFEPVDADGRAAPALSALPTAVPEQRKSELRRRAFVDHHYRMLRRLLDGGVRRDETCGLRVADLPTTAETAVYLQRRSEVLLPTHAQAPVLLTEDGRPVDADEVDDHLARLRIEVADG